VINGIFWTTFTIGVLLFIVLVIEWRSYRRVQAEHELLGPEKALEMEPIYQELSNLSQLAGSKNQN
jgi:hypothetical protein